MSSIMVVFLGMSLLAAPPQADDVVLRISGPLEVSAGEMVGTAIVINDDVVIDGRVRGQLIVINGTARVRGTVGGVTVLNGRLELAAAARVTGDVMLYRSVLERTTGAAVSGRVIYEVLPTFRQVAWLVWLATTLVLVLAALAYTFLARRQLQTSAELLRRRPGAVGIATLLVVGGLPAAAFLSVLSGVGVPVAIALLIFVLPVVALLGYVITGTSIGQLVTSVEPRLARRPYVAAGLGVLALQLMAAVPPLGMLFVVIATQVGAGALAYYLWQQHRRVPAAA
jgi:cytoskeletal protein CcmA (bactofilin family)